MNQFLSRKIYGNNNRRNLCFLLLLVSQIFLVLKAYAETSAAPNEEPKIYKSRDQFGTPVFSDQASDRAEEITLERGISYDGAKANQEYSGAARITQAPSAGATQALAPYETLSVLKPEDGEAIRANAGNVTVTIHVVPAIKQGHIIEILLDGVLVKSSSDTINLENVDRGTHQVQLRVVQVNNGKVFQESPITSFTLLRHSILNRSSANN